MSLRLLAPAKLNLGLELIARRDDGYHDIETVFLPLRLYDELWLEARPPAEGVRLELVGSGGGVVPPNVGKEGGTGARVPRDASNLAIRACRAAMEALGWEAGLCIRLHKRIPVAAGLGGGSSDAAMAILGVEALAGADLGRERRRSIARALGADVPFFLDPRPALGRGVGDVLEPLAGVPEMHWVLVAFDFGVPTPWAYGEASRRVQLPRSASGQAARIAAGELDAAPCNDLEPAAAAAHPEIGRARLALERAGARISGMSGSGPTVYGRFGSVDEAGRAAAALELRPGARALAVSSPGSDLADWDWGVAKR